MLAHKVGVLGRHCDELGRDADEIHVSTQGLLFLSTDESWLAQHRSDDASRPVLVGTPDGVVEMVGRYREAGADELIVPGFTFGGVNPAKETCDLFTEAVAPSFR